MIELSRLNIGQITNFMLYFMVTLLFQIFIWLVTSMTSDSNDIKNVCNQPQNKYLRINW